MLQVSDVECNMHRWDEIFLRDASKMYCANNCGIMPTSIISVVQDVANICALICIARIITGEDICAICMATQCLARSWAQCALSVTI